MITNDVQYRTTKTLLGQFEEQPETWRRPVRRTRSCTSCRLTLLVLRHAISRARSPSTSTPIRCEADTLGELHTLLVRARVVRGWSQRRLAAELGIAEQQIQCYEASGYATASLARLCEIAKALGLRVRETAELLANVEPSKTECFASSAPARRQKDPRRQVSILGGELQECL